MGSTQNGTDWCTKALHPSDPLTEVRGIPDHNAVPTLLMNYQSTYTISASPGATGVWSFNASLLPHPINFMYVDMYDTNYPAGQESNFMNTQITGVTHFDKYKTLREIAQRWRLAYMSVTCYQDGPDLANQGSIVVSQPAVLPNAQKFAGIYGSSAVSLPFVHQFTSEDRPDFVTSQSMPSAYFSRSREGAYVPLKLTKTCQQWVSDADKVGSSPIGIFQTQPDTYALPEAPNLPGFPHTNLVSVWWKSGTGCGGEATSPMLNSTWAHICTRNLATTTSFSFFVRCGIEMQVHPSSLLSPQLKLAPSHDEVALDAYFAIARVLKDGYPSDHNDLGKIWDIISASARKILPLAQKIPGIAAPANMVEGMLTLGDQIRARRKPKKKVNPKQVQPPGKQSPQRKQPRKKGPKKTKGSR